MRVVFDTNTVVSALLFGGSLAWLVDHWRSRISVPLVSRATADEFLRTLQYPKFGLSTADIESYVARYLPLAERTEVDETALSIPECRDPKDRPFLALALAGHADVLVTGDDDLLSLGGAVPFQIETPAQYAKRF
ncbi:MAG: putative toxin-antitoxin system toxin component, PIN family [Betaproteobacteria bacterium]|nr:putative toxin-antitoxin system toxin component, PIN family [Betaproteobacteria bacterium]